MRRWALLLLITAGPAWAVAPSERTVCGQRDGTAGNAYLVARDGRVMIELARQGGSQELLEQADRRVGPQPRGETGTQNGVRYCLVLRYDARGQPVAVVAGRRAAMQ